MGANAKGRTITEHRDNFERNQTQRGNAIRVEMDRKMRETRRKTGTKRFVELMKYWTVMGD